MSSGFVSGGTTDAPIERSDEWLAAQVELEANRRRKADEAAAQNSGRSLFETLEANKAAKQDAFEEASRLKNQFRALDNDEIDFLDSVLESTRAEEARVRKETNEGLEVFRRRQEELDKAAKGETGAETTTAVADDEWATAAKKRKRGKEGALKGLKLRKASSSDSATGKQAGTTEDPGTEGASVKVETQKGKNDLASPHKGAEAKPTIATATEKLPVKPTPEKAVEPKPALGLVDYGSDEDDDW
ncbi:hypothetical protein VE04_06360 [Pseudogymnoascus sp. 24MN13]|nr:hypothetical protein VE04_06360 [Pseudogymnoascus sp. 24MN13]